MDMLECIRNYLDSRRLAYEQYPLAGSADELGASLGFAPGQLLRTVLLRERHGLALAVIPSDRQLDTAAVAALGGRPYRIAGPHALARLFPRLGAAPLPPIGLHWRLAVLADERIGEADGVYFQAGTAAVIRIQSDTFQRLHAGALWGDISRHPPRRRILRTTPQPRRPRFAWSPHLAGARPLSY